MSLPQNWLPAVLTFDGPQSSISVYRALKQARELMEMVMPDDGSNADKVQATLDDLELMMKAVK